MLLGVNKMAYSPRPRIAVLTPNFVYGGEHAPDLKTCPWGGGERYLVDLARLLTRLGFHVEAFQPSVTTWRAEVLPGLTLNGLGIGYQGEWEFHSKAGEAFRKQTTQFDHHIYLNLDGAVGATSESIVISHGVWWDRGDDFERLPPTRLRRSRNETWIRLMESAMSKASNLVSVDTNTINWARCMFGPQVANRFTYIPNYADETLYPAARADRCPSRRFKAKPTILFGRRLVQSRGSQIAIDLVKRLHARGYKVNHRFVYASGDKSYSDQIHKMMDKVSVGSVEMDGMENEYLGASISLVPTLHCEGTSLTCIESMAAGCVVVASHPGGIGNLIQDRVSGRLVEPNLDAFEEAVVDILEDPQMGSDMAKMARKVFLMGYTKTLWEQRWEALIRKVGWLCY